MVTHYSFNHKAGMVHVRRRTDGGWLFEFAYRCTGRWETPETAVSKIRNRHTGNRLWDARVDAEEVPASLRDWYPAPVRICNA